MIGGGQGGKKKKTEKTKTRKNKGEVEGAEETAEVVVGGKTSTKRRRR